MKNSSNLPKVDNIKAFFFDNDSTVFNHSGIGKEILDNCSKTMEIADWSLAFFPTFFPFAFPNDGNSVLRKTAH